MFWKEPSLECLFLEKQAFEVLLMVQSPTQLTELLWWDQFLVNAMLTVLSVFAQVWVKVADMVGFWPNKSFMGRHVTTHGAMIHADSRHMPILN